MMDVYIVGAKRTPIGSFNGILKDLSAVDLSICATSGAIEQSGIQPEIVDELLLGNVLAGNQGMNPARQVSIGVGMSEVSHSATVNMVCGSGMRTIVDAVSHIKSGDVSIAVAAGTESMSNVPFAVSSSVRTGVKIGNIQQTDLILKDGLTDAMCGIHMGITAENIAEKLNITRNEQDHFAMESQQKASIAQKERLFEAEIAPVDASHNRQVMTVVDDEYIKHKTTLESLSGLRPAFKNNGTVTAGNSSGINDGASSLVLMAEDVMHQQSVSPLVRIVSYAQAGVSPELMGLGPVPAIKKALHKANLNLNDIDILELNEAFSAQSLGVLIELSKATNIELEELKSRTNPNGGAIALGHPLGASGNRIVVSLIYEMKKRNVRYGLASLCIGGGMGIAMILENQ
ncbi:acetyl-CoA C-acetyltransferase [Vibrio mediterranei]